MLEKVTFDFGILSILLLAYGSAVTGSNPLTTINNLFAPFPSFQTVVSSLTPGTSKCAAWDFTCQASNGVATATGYVGAVIAYPNILIWGVIGRIQGFASSVTNVIFGPANGLASVPYIPFVIAILLLMAGYEIFRMLRGNASAGTS